MGDLCPVTLRMTHHIDGDMVKTDQTSRNLIIEHVLGKDETRAARGVLRREDILSIEFLRANWKHMKSRFDSLDKAASAWKIDPISLSAQVLAQFESQSVFVKVKLVKGKTILPVTDPYSPYFGSKYADEPSSFQYQKSNVLIFKVNIDPFKGSRTTSYAQTQWKYTKHFFGSLGNSSNYNISVVYTFCIQAHQH